MQFQLNIGLDVPHTVANHARQAAKALGLLQDTFSHVTVRIEQSATEPTLVVTLSASPARVYADVARISDALGQDCIAVYCPQRRTGALVGTKAAQWGVFNPANFIGA
jgi:hypothetical protein